MPTAFHKLFFSTSAEIDVIDITASVRGWVQNTVKMGGLVTIYVPGSTATVTTIEYEPGVVEDLKKAIERLIPSDIPYAHDERWNDGNGFAHVRAAFFKPSICVPVNGGRLVLGNWQQIVLIDFDNKPRNREIIVHAVA